MTEVCSPSGSGVPPPPKIARRKAGRSSGKPMSGLSIPNEYHFKAKPEHRTRAVRRKQHVAATTISALEKQQTHL